MKVVARFCAILSVASSPVASKPFVIDKRPTHHLVSTKKALGIRGGDVLGLPISQEDLATLFVGWYGLNAIISVPAPAKAAELYNQKVEPGELNYWIFENMYNAVAGIAVMAYLATFKGIDATKVVAYGAISCTYLSVKNFLDGTFEKLGVSTFGTIQTVIMLVCMFMLFSGRGDASLVAKILSAPPLVVGLAGYFDPEAVASSINLDIGKDENTKVFLKWFGFNLLSWGTLAMTLLYDGDWKHAIGYTAALLALGMVDEFFVSENVEKMNLPKMPMYFVTALGLIVSVGLLYEGGGSAPTPAST